MATNPTPPTQLHPGQTGKGAAGDISFALVPETDFLVRAVLQHSHIYSYNMGSNQAQGSALGYAALKTLGYLTQQLNRVSMRYHSPANSPGCPGHLIPSGSDVLGWQQGDPKKLQRLSCHQPPDEPPVWAHFLQGGGGHTHTSSKTHSRDLAPNAADNFGDFLWFIPRVYLWFICQHGKHQHGEAA